MTTNTNASTAVDAAARSWLARQCPNATEHPAGAATPKGYWYPDDRLERQPCCRAHRPRQMYPRAIEAHCRGAEHIANLHEVPVNALRAAVKTLRATNTP